MPEPFNVWAPAPLPCPSQPPPAEPPLVAAWAARDGSGTTPDELEALAIWTANLHDYAIRAWRVCGAGAGSGSSAQASHGAGAPLVP